MAQITLRTIAERAGVSPSAVSRVLRDDKTCFISRAKRDRVLDVSRELGYVPNFAARNLVLGRTSHIAFVYCRPLPLENIGSFLLRTVQGAENQARDAGFILSMVTIPYEDRAELRRICSQRALYDGIVFTAGSLTPAGAALVARSGMPAVLMEDDPLFPAEIPLLVTSKERGISEAVAYLKGMGHGRIGYYGNNPNTMAQFASAMERNGLRLDGRHTFTFRGCGIYDQQIESFFGADGVLERRRECTAVFCCNDLAALGLCRRLRREGIRPGEDISVMGFDDMEPFLGIPEPDRFLTTVHRPREEAGRRAVELLVGVIGARSRVASVEELPCSLVTRTSVAARGQPWR